MNAKKIIGRIIQAPFWIFVFGSFLVSVYAWGKGIQNVKISVPIILFVIIATYFLGRRLTNNSKNSDGEKEEETSDEMQQEELQGMYEGGY
jgi:uncharacterized membrane protein